MTLLERFSICSTRSWRFIGGICRNILTTEMVKTMNKDAVIFAMANPTPNNAEDALAGGAKIELEDGLSLK